MNGAEVIGVYQDLHRETFGTGCTEEQAARMVRDLKPVLLSVDPPALTPRQKEALDAIRGYMKAEGVAPTLEELSAILGCKVANTSALVTHLVNKGVLRRRRNQARSMEIVGE